MIVKVLVGWSRANVYDFYLTIAGEREREKSQRNEIAVDFYRSNICYLANNSPIDSSIVDR